MCTAQVAKQTKTATCDFVGIRLWAIGMRKNDPNVCQFFVSSQQTKKSLVAKTRDAGSVYTRAGLSMPGTCYQRLTSITCWITDTQLATNSFQLIG